MREPMRPTSKSICPREAADRTGAWQGAMDGAQSPGAEKGSGGGGSCSFDAIH